MAIRTLAPRRAALPPATKPLLDISLPYKIVLANLHSQTRHSDGGAALDACKGAQEPQTAPFGPDRAPTAMRSSIGLDVLLASEHNHMYDGSDGTNAAAEPAEAKALYQDGPGRSGRPALPTTPAFWRCTAWNGA